MKEKLSMNSVARIRTDIMLGFVFLLLPSVLGFPSALVDFIAYKYLNVKMQLEPIWLETVGILFASIAGISCMLVLKRITKTTNWQVIIFFFPIFIYGWAKCLTIETEFLSFLGYSCCREEPATFISIAKIALNPVAPFWGMFVH